MNKLAEILGKTVAYVIGIPVMLVISVLFLGTLWIAQKLEETLLKE